MSWTCPHPHCERCLSHQREPAKKKNRNMLGDIERGMRLSMAGGAKDWDHFMATLWGESLRTDALRVWDAPLIEILHSHLPCQVWYDMMVARYGRLIADAKQQPQLTDECAKSTGKIWKFTRCSQYKKEFVFFFRWHPVEAHRFICIMGWCVCGCALDYSAVFSLCCLLPLPSLPHTKQSKYARS